MLKELTVEDIRGWSTYYDPVEMGMCKEDWKGTILDILDKSSVSVSDRIWCALKCLGDRERRLFAVWCSRRALSHTKSPDPRSIKAIDVAERFANGQATAEELSDAAHDAYNAVVNAATHAAYAAANDAANAAASSAAYAAADDSKEREVQLRHLRKLFRSGKVGTTN